MHHGRVSERSMFDSLELNSVLQKGTRCVALHGHNAWVKYLYFADEISSTMAKSREKLYSLATEDKAQCPAEVLKLIVEVLSNSNEDKGTSVPKIKGQSTLSRQQVIRRALLALAAQRLDRSSAYLSVACLARLNPHGRANLAPPLASSRATLWREAVTIAGLEFSAGMEHIISETDAVPLAYPMSRDTVLRLAAAFSHLDHWQMRYPDSKLVRNEIRDRALSEAGLLTVRRPRLNVTVRGVILGLIAVTRWMQRVQAEAKEKGGSKAIPFEVQTLVGLHLQAVMSVCGSKKTRVHLSANVILLLLADRYTTHCVPYPRPEDIDVPGTPRAFPMPAFAQDKHTLRGSTKNNTLEILRNRCRQQGVPMPANPHYSHGPSAHSSPQGFDEFMEHIDLCERLNGGGIKPWFKEEALSLYMKQPNRRRKRKFVLEGIFGTVTRQEEGCKKPKLATLLNFEKWQECAQWIAMHQAGEGEREIVQWEELSRRAPIAQLATANKPNVYLDFATRRVIKGPFTNHLTVLRSFCLTKLAREVFGLFECVPKMLAFLGFGGRSGLIGPMIGDTSWNDDAPKAVNRPLGRLPVCANAQRGMLKLHEWVIQAGRRRIDMLWNFIFVLKIQATKFLLESSDNNTSNMLVVMSENKVYGVDFGGYASADIAAKAEDAAMASNDRNGASPSLAWIFSKRPNKLLLEQIDALAQANAVTMAEWLVSLRTNPVLRHYKEVCNQFPPDVVPGDYSSRLDAILRYYEGLCYAQFGCL